VFEILIEITVGEYQHHETHLFEGTEEEAKAYAAGYLAVIWGADPVSDGVVHYSADGGRAARLYSVRELKTVWAENLEGGRMVEVSFS
jgi:hypothetical protein